MKTRMTTLILAACACLALSGLRAYADEKPAAALVIKDLKSATEADKLKSLNGLAHLGPQAADATKFIEGLLKDSSAKVRVHAALALGAIGPAAKDSVPALAELLKDPAAAVRRSVFHAVRAIRPGPKVMIPLATKLLEDADPAIRGRVLNTIAEAGTEAVPGLIEALKHEKAVFWALIVLRDIGPAAKDAVPGITETLKDKRPEVRREAVLTLGAMGEAAASAAPEIAKLLGDENTAVAATFVLGELGQIPKGSEATIQANAKSADKLLSSTSLWALARVHPENKELRRETTEKLVERLKDEDPFVRAAAARALAALPPAPDITAPIWEKALKGADETTLRNALDSLAELGAAAVPRLIEALKYEKVRPEVIYMLGRIGPAAAPATAALAKLVENKDSRVAHEAIIALGDIGPGANDAVPALIKALGQADDRDLNFAAIAFALGKIGPGAAAAEAALLNELASKDDNVRLLSAWALAQIRPTAGDVAAKAVPVLIAGLALPDAEDEVLAAAALGTFGPLGKDAAEALKKAAGDSDKYVSEAAAAALKAVEKAVPAPAPAVVLSDTNVKSPAPATYKPGDNCVTVEDKVEVGMNGSQGQIVPKGTKLRVLEIRGSWIGVQAEVDGKMYKGWVLSGQIGRP